MDHHEAVDYAKMVMAAAALIFALSFMFLVLWMALSEPKTKLYEADNVVCQNAPLTSQCFERKPR